MSVPWIAVTHGTRRWWDEATATEAEILIRWVADGVMHRAKVRGWWDDTTHAVKPLIIRGWKNGTFIEDFRMV